MQTLPNGCSCSNISVYPRNWKSKSASIKVAWYINYRFYDPSGQSKQVRIYCNNRIKDVVQRQAEITERIKIEEDLLFNQGYNPILNTTKQRKDGPVESSSLFIDALKTALKRIPGVKGTLNDMGCVIRGTEKAAIALGYAALEIREVRRKHIKMILDHLTLTNPRFSARRYNLYRAYLMKLFKELVELEAIDHNPLHDISTKKQTRKVRPTLSDEERSKVSGHLKNRSYPFWRFVQIFFHSGARETELMSLQAKSVDLSKQRYLCLIKKGKQYREVYRTIKDIALPLWEELLNVAKPEDYLFSKNLVPGASAIRPDQVGRRWNKYVKKELGIRADLYSLKHLHTSETVDSLNEKDAAAMNAHTSTAMVIGIYDTGREKRQHERLRKLNNPFS